MMAATSGTTLGKKDVYFTFEFRNYLNLLRSPIGLKTCSN